MIDINKKKILIIGITGFLGRNLIKIITKNHNNKYSIFGTGNTTDKINKLVNMYNIPIIQINVLDNFCNLENMFKIHKFDYVINTVALKHVNIAEDYPSKAIELNVVYTLNLLKLSKKYNVTNLINISSTQANNPINIYGITKYLMEKMTLEYNYSIYQGVNFFWSDNSVLDIWYNRIKENKNIYVNDNNQERYFIDVENVCNDILDNLNNTGIKITSNKLFKVKIIDLFNAMILYFNYDIKKCDYIKTGINEKIKDDLNSDINIKYLTIEKISEKISQKFSEKKQ